MNAFVRPMRELEQAAALEAGLETPGTIQVSGCIDAGKPHMIYSVGNGYKHKIIVSFREQKARELLADYRFFDRGAIYYPAKDILFYQADIQGNVVAAERMHTLKRLIEGEALTIFTTYDAFMDALPPLEQQKRSVLAYKVGDCIEVEALKETLVSMGYERNYQVERPGEFAVRGGIIDIYSLTEEAPFRMELWDDEIDSIRSFDAESQRSIENLEYISVYPATEPDTAGSVSFLEYFNPEETLLFFDDGSRCMEKGRQTYEEFAESRKHRLEKGQEPGNIVVYSTEELSEKIKAYRSVVMTTLDVAPEGFAVKEALDFHPREIGAYQNSFERLVKDLKRYKSQGWRVMLTSASKSRAQRLAGDFLQEGLNSFYTDDYDHELKPGELMVVHGKMRQGFEYPEIKFAMIADSDIFGQEKKRRKKKTAYSGQKIHSFTDLNVGDYVVHENHGLGIYRGIEKVEIEGVTKDYMKIEYARGGNLYIQVTQLDVIQKYSGGEGRRPKLNTLGGAEWKKTKNRVRTAVNVIADELVQLYAVRQQREGYVYGPDTVWQKEFEELFPFEETDDQIQAIEAVKRDMESTKIMDRLICGDVGYGKTEIAIRAAFKAVQEGKQVVYLVPTTILAQQHYNTFSQRMKDFPVTVDMMCRFKTPAENKKTIEKLKKGTVDIVIGTHRLLSKDVGYKDLGLLIIDEEQRFGVTHKEKIKQLKNNVDVITLTATPIPRTLHMSLIGIRDMSVLEEAPMDRQPIQTFVMEYDEEIVREAISRELQRGGQVFYVYNRVNNIADIAGKIAKLVPEATVSFAHGQMREHELEKIMMRFIDGEIDVLVSTTIVETGLDISNVNTMIIHDADNFGLSQLYQLRGRVGRSNRTAYAFLMYRKNKLLKETAEKRLGAIREFTELGSGIRIAMRDLEIRGAGNLLGEMQHGNMEAVGYDLYCKMLNEAVRERKGETVEESFETTIDLNVDAYIPSTYISNEFWKLDIYKRIAAMESEEEREEMEDELLDRFGDLPKAVVNLLQISRIKWLAHEVYVTSVTEAGFCIKLQLYEKAKIDPVQIPRFLQQYPQRLKFSAADLTFSFQVNEKEKKAAQLKELEALLDAMKVLCEAENKSLPQT